MENDFPFNYYQNNLPSNENFNGINNNAIIYSEIFNSRKYFSIIDINKNNILISKQSLNKIAKMSSIKLEDYLSFINKNKITSLYLFSRDEENNIIFDEDIKNNENEENSMDDGFKKVENFEDNFFEPLIYKRCFCFYIFLIFCSIWDFIFYLYIINVTIFKDHAFTIYTLILSLFSFLTGIYGLIKSKIKNFSGYILKICTILIPIFVLIGIIIYLSCNIEFDLYWVKMIIDVLTIIISIVLISFITGLITPEVFEFNDDNNKTNTNQINQNLINDNNNRLQNNIDIDIGF